MPVARMPLVRPVQAVYRFPLVRLSRLTQPGVELLARRLLRRLATVAPQAAVPTVADQGHGSGSDVGIALRLLRRLCHDVRQELAVIQALVELAATEPGSSERSQHRLRQISARASYITEMMRQVVERTDGLIEVDLADLMANVVADVQLRIDTRFHLHVMPGSVVANPVMLRRAALNMVDNAVRAAGPAGSVTVRVNVDGQDALIAVEDSGPGFGNAAPGLASLGLGVVHDCARFHGGHVDAGTRGSGGAFVHLWLPQAPPLHLVSPREE